MRKFKSNIKKIIESLGYLTTIFSNEVDPKFEIKSERENSFCGYYDFNPIFKEKLIFNSISKSQSEGDLNLKCKIKLFNLKTRKSSLVFNSKTWNWQLGSRVMWLGNNKIILNDACKNDFERTNILNEDGNLIQTLPFNFWNKLTLKDNHLIGRINMHTLSFLRPGYGYKSKCYKGNYQFLEIYTLDKETFAEQKIFELDSKQLEEISLKFFNHKEFYLNHILFSPEGKWCITCMQSSDKKNRNTHMIVIDLENKNFWLPLTNCIISHHTFIDNNTLLVFVIGSNYSNYVNINLRDKSFNFDSLNGYSIDGHPSKAKENLILDTYPSRLGFQKLLISRNIRQKPVNALSLRSPLSKNFGPSRCDLHPRYDNFNNLVLIDYLRDNLRIIRAYDFDQLLKK